MLQLKKYFYVITQQIFGPLLCTVLSVSDISVKSISNGRGSEQNQGGLKRFVDWKYKEKFPKETAEEELAERLEDKQKGLMSWKLREVSEE